MQVRHGALVFDDFAQPFVQRHVTPLDGFFSQVGDRAVRLCAAEERGHITQLLQGLGTGAQRPAVTCARRGVGRAGGVGLWGCFQRILAGFVCR